jgi:CheY-like chemotaxis protein
MSRVLMVDDSPHAQRMGERILTEEGYEVVTVSNVDSALIRLDDVDPDVVIADTVMPGRNGYELCQYIKMSPRHRYVKVVLTAGVLEPLDDAEAKRVSADGTLKKPFEASALVGMVKPLSEAAATARTELGAAGAASDAGKTRKQPIAPFVAVVDAEQVRAAVTVALDASMEAMIEEITRRVMIALNPKKAEPLQLAAPTSPEPPQPASPPAAAPKTETVRRVSALRLRSGSILGLDIARPDSEDISHPPAPER